MLGSRRAICALRKGLSTQTQIRFIQNPALKPLKHLTVEGDTPDLQLGTYPQPQGISNQQLPPKGWWDNQYRRNFGEPLHEEDEALNMFSPDIPQPNIEPSSALAQATVAFAVLGGIMGLLAYTRPTMPADRRSFPRDGLVNELGGWDANKAKTESLEEH